MVAAAERCRTGQQLQGVPVILHGVVPPTLMRCLKHRICSPFTPIPPVTLLSAPDASCRLVDRVGPSIGEALTTQGRVPRILCSPEELPTGSLDSLSRPPADSPDTTRRSSCTATMFHLSDQAENLL